MSCTTHREALTSTAKAWCGRRWPAAAISPALIAANARCSKDPRPRVSIAPRAGQFIPVPGPSFKGTDARADWHYLNWVDRYDTLGFGKDVQVVLGTGSDSLLIFKPETKQWLTVRVPYPMGFYTRDIDGRIDNPNTGWKGRGLWASTETRVIWHAEGGKGQVPQMVHFQLRPDPLAR
jgi:hypothetical protein